jgi:hypothetical protein
LLALSRGKEPPKNSVFIGFLSNNQYFTILGNIRVYIERIDKDNIRENRE